MSKEWFPSLYHEELNFLALYPRGLSCTVIVVRAKSARLCVVCTHGDVRSIVTFLIHTHTG